MFIDKNFALQFPVNSRNDSIGIEQKNMIGPYFPLGPVLKFQQRGRFINPKSLIRHPSFQKTLIQSAYSVKLRLSRFPISFKGKTSSNMDGF